MSECIFCQIVSGAAPAEVVYEDEHTVAFLDLAQATEGHTLVVPRAHAEDLFDIGQEAAANVTRAVVRVASLLREALDCPGLNVVQANGAVAWQSVFHFHVHVVPRYAADELTLPWEPRFVPFETLGPVAEKIRSVALG